MKMMKKSSPVVGSRCSTHVPGDADACPSCRSRLRIGIGPVRFLVTAAAVAIPLAILLTLGGCKASKPAEADRPTAETAAEMAMEDKPVASDSKIIYRDAAAAAVQEDNPAKKDGAATIQENDPSTKDGASAALKTPDSEPKTGDSLYSKKDPERFHVGDIIQDGNMKVMYTACGDYYEESEYHQPEAGHKYIFLEFAFENMSEDRDRSVSFWSFKCYADGFEANSYFRGDDDLSSVISAGRMSMGKIYFSVPKDAKEIEVEYTQNYSPSDKLIFLFEGNKDSGKRLAARTTPTEGAAAVGDTIETDIQKISYLSCEKDETYNTFDPPAKGCSYYTLTFETENLSASDISVSTYDFSCYADGYACRSTIFRDDVLSADLASGRKTTGTVTFEVPDSAKTVEAEYPVNTWTDEHVVFTIR